MQIDMPRMVFCGLHPVSPATLVECYCTVDDTRLFRTALTYHLPTLDVPFFCL